MLSGYMTAPRLRITGTLTLLLAVSLPLAPAGAESMAMRDYHLLDIGMSEAEVLHRVGPPDHETVVNDGFFGPSGFVWYYIPTEPRGWITEIIFDSHGRIKDTRRYKP